MIKTYIDIPRRDHMYYMLHDIITMRNGWDVITTVTRPDNIRIYFSYKWFQYGKVRAFKKAVKNYAKRVTYYDHTYIPKYLFAQETKDHIQTNSKKSSQSFPTQQQFKEVLDAEISKL